MRPSHPSGATTSLFMGPSTPWKSSTQFLNPPGSRRNPVPGIVPPDEEVAPNVLHGLGSLNSGIWGEEGLPTDGQVMNAGGLLTGQSSIARPVSSTQNYGQINPENRMDYVPLRNNHNQLSSSKDINRPPTGGSPPNNGESTPFSRGGSNPFGGGDPNRSSRGGGPNRPGGGGDSNRPRGGGGPNRPGRGDGPNRPGGGGNPPGGGGGGDPPFNRGGGGNHFPGGIPQFPLGSGGGGGNGPPGDPGGGYDPQASNNGDESDLREYIPYGTNVPTIKAELKHENLPTWDGNHETAIEYFWQGGVGIIIPDRGPVGWLGRQAVKKKLEGPKFWPKNRFDGLPSA